MTKITLDADDSVIEQATEMARSKGMSVSGLFAFLVKGLARSRTDEYEPGQKEAPITRGLRGIASAPDDQTDRQLYEAATRDKARP